MYTCKNYNAPGKDELHIGGKLIFDDGGKLEGGLLPNVKKSDFDGSDTVAKVRTSLDDLLTKLKNSGLMEGDTFTLTYGAVTDSVAGHADRQFNTNKIASVAIANDVITITLSCKVSALKDFDGGGKWGVHKWLGIGISAGINPITGLYYNGAALTAEDVSEATTCDLSAGYFVRWVAADLVLANDGSEASKGAFTLWADGFKKTKYTLKIVEG